jgi:hypothetical protein
MSSALSSSSPDRHDQCGGPATDIVRPAGGVARVEIKVDAKLAEPCDLGAIPRVSHAMDHAQRRIAEMADAGLDQVASVKLV